MILHPIYPFHNFQLDRDAIRRRRRNSIRLFNSLILVLLIGTTPGIDLRCIIMNYLDKNLRNLYRARR